MKITGLITKMMAEYADPIQYFLNLDNEVIMMNQLLGKRVKIRFNHYHCMNCGQDKEIFAMGFCKNCYFLSPHAGEWVVRPELSKAHLGIADRNLVFEQEAQLQPHIVYLANSGGAKVGVTRKSQIPVRWIDQGAEYAVKLAQTDNRYEAGRIEVALKQHISDKTNYRKMLSQDVPYIDLNEKKQQLLNFVPTDLQHFILSDDEITKLRYPVMNYPLGIQSVNLKKDPEIEGILIGIKGQYLLFDNNLTINLRSHEGFVADWDV
ncbi:MAG: DUF2797 domain-containing protein [Flavobacteriaceae bacterium]|jgi:hypothetical protein|nr:DUF2797 domain-containing protein [Flavobacteriaceae bacterium]